MFGKHGFNGSLLRAKLCEHELFSVRSIAFISTVAKLPDETWDKYKALCMWTTRGYYTSGLVSSTTRLRLRSPASSLLAVHGNMQNFFLCMLTFVK